MSILDSYTEGLRQAQDTLTGIGGDWFRDVKSLFGAVPAGFTQLDPSEAFEQASRLTQRLVEVNVEYVQDLAVAVRKHITGLASVMSDGATSASKAVDEEAEQVRQTAFDQAEEIERTERAEARRAKKAVHDEVAARYQDMTKVELSDELAHRDLPKSGNVEELRARLIENDLQ
jgi:hypothetical protein